MATHDKPRYFKRHTHDIKCSFFCAWIFFWNTKENEISLTDDQYRRRRIAYTESFGTDFHYAIQDQSEEEEPNYYESDEESSIDWDRIKRSLRGEDDANQSRLVATEFSSVTTLSTKGHVNAVGC